MPSQTPPQSYTMSPPRWSVPSATTEGTEYAITVNEHGERVCNCQANDYPKTRGRCWHLKAVGAGMVRPVVRISQRPARRAISDEMRDFVSGLDV